MRLATKVAVVTGAAGGIGEAIARRFAQEGAKVVLSDILEIGGHVAQEIRDAGGEAVFVKTDVSKAEDVAQLIRMTEEKFGALHVLCNNAAVNIPGSVVELTEEIWDRTYEVNVKSMFLAGKYGVPLMKKSGGGSIINMGSANSFIAEERLSAYVSTKGSILMLTKAMALDFARDNIRVNCICPGWVDTKFNDAHAELFGGREAVLEVLPEIQPLGRPIRPEEIANVALFLASEESSCITGAPIIADGGIMAK